jgi:hypothetical protein
MILMKTRVRIIWEASEYNTPFLDMLVYIDPIRQSVEYKPYQKKLNHKERIPWLSHHPKDVKKGTFVGEMSRLATISSLVDTYCEAIYDLKCLYVNRGYPPVLLDTWIKANLQKRWDHRLDKQSTRDAARPILVLKTEFNPAWYNFNVKEFGDSITSVWSSYLHRIYEHMDNLERRERARPVQRLDVGQQFVLRQPGEAASSDNAPIPYRVPGASSSMEDAVKARANAVAAMPERRWMNIASSPRPCDWFTDHLEPGSTNARNRRTFDVIKVGLVDSQFIVSRKRTRNFMDIASVWKQSVLQNIRDADAASDSSDEYWAALDVVME